MPSPSENGQRRDGRATSREILQKLSKDFDQILEAAKDSKANSARIRSDCDALDARIAALQETPSLLPESVRDGEQSPRPLAGHFSQQTSPAHQPYSDVVDGAKYRELEAQHQAAQAKLQQIALNLVRTLRERNELDEKTARLTEVVTRLTDELSIAQERIVVLQNMAAARDAALAEAQSTKELALHRENELAAIRRELRLRTSAFEKLSVDAREKQLAVQAEKEALLAQVSQQMVDLVAEHEAVIDANEEMYFACDKAAGDLRAALRRGMELERRAEAAERALDVERQALLAFASTEEERVTGQLTNGSSPAALDEAAAADPHASGATAAANGAVSMKSALALRQQVVRLEARLRAQTAATDAAHRRNEERLAGLLESKDAAEARASEFEAAVRSLKRQLAVSAREATAHQLAAQQCRKRLEELKEEARFVTGMMLVTRADVEHMYVVTDSNFEAQQFVDRVALDLFNCSKFLSRVRSVETGAIGLLAPPAQTPGGVSPPGATPVRSTSGPSEAPPAISAPPQQRRFIAPLNDDDSSGGTVLGVLDSYAARKNGVRQAPVASPQ